MHGLWIIATASRRSFSKQTLASRLTETQLNLFNDAPEPITTAIANLTANAFLLPNHQDFVRQLGTQLTTLPAGSVILAAVPPAAAEDDLCNLLQVYLEQAQARGTGPGSAGLAIMNVLTARTSKRMEEALLDRYSDVP